MKEYTAIYNTKTMNGVQYSFKAENLDVAVEFCSHYFSIFPSLAIIENSFFSKANKGKLVWLNGGKVI